MKRFFSILFGAVLASQAVAATGYYRSPDLHQQNLLFTAEGDLWLSSLDGNTSRRLTTHPSEEIQGAFSPDGSQVAFVANYAGSNEIYVMPFSGGIAKRLTFENAGIKLQGWTPNGEVLYSTNRTVGAGPHNSWTLITVDPTTLANTPLPLADAVQASMAGDDLYFVQFGLQVSTDNALTYRGGAKGTLWHFDLDNRTEARRLIADHQGSIRNPLTDGKRIYFVSDASGSDNIWSVNKRGSDLRQETNHQDWPVRQVKLDNGRLIYQLAADLYLHDISAKQGRMLTVQITSDAQQMREQWENKPLKRLNSARYNGHQARVAITAKGKVATAGIDKSRLTEIATPKDSRTRQAVLSKDGKSVFALNDSSGEIELWQYPADGSDGSKRLTTDGKTFRWNLYPSPDGKFIAHDDKDGNLWLLDLESGENRLLIDDNNGLYPFVDVVWSHNSKLLALTRSFIENDRTQIQLYDVEDNQRQILTSERYASFSPAFSTDDNWLYFISNRSFKASPGSPWGDRNLGPKFDRRGQIFAIALKQDAKFPFQAPNELALNQEDEEKDNSKEDEANGKEQPQPVRVDWQGLSERLWQVPLPSGNYSNLGIAAKRLYVLDRIGTSSATIQLKSSAIEHGEKLTTFADKVADYQLSVDGKQLFVRLRGSDNSKMYIVKAGDKLAKDLSKSTINSKDWQLAYTPSQEWQQIFYDAWLMHRDSFFDKDMRGLDWQQIKARYQPLVARVTDRRELNDVLAMMIGELNALHSQVRGGDMPADESAPKPSELGAVLDQQGDNIVIARILRHEPELPARAAPLAKPGVDARDGDIIAAINGKQVSNLAEVHRALLNQAGKQVLLDLVRGEQSLKTIVKPVSAGSNYMLRYYDWVQGKKHTVEDNNQDIGYLHIHAMGSADIARFAEDFYAMYHKQGLIIDVRRNRGGNIDSWLIEKLLRKSWAFWDTTSGDRYSNMQQTFRGHLVVLADEFTYSDGETFTAAVKALNLGPVIGKQTAGAGVWLTGRNRLTDNGIARVAEFPQYASDGRWIIEGRGVSPDIEVTNLPHATFNGQDAQLEAALNYLAEKIAKQPVPPFEPEPFGNRDQPAKDIL